MEYKEKLQKFNYIKWIKQYDSSSVTRPLGIYKITNKTNNRFRVYNSGTIADYKEKVNFIFVTDKYAEKYGYTDIDGTELIPNN